MLRGIDHEGRSGRRKLAVGGRCSNFEVVADDQAQGVLITIQQAKGINPSSLGRLVKDDVDSRIADICIKCQSFNTRHELEHVVVDHGSYVIEQGGTCRTKIQIVVRHVVRTAEDQGVTACTKVDCIGAVNRSRVVVRTNNVRPHVDDVGARASRDRVVVFRINPQSDIRSSDGSAINVAEGNRVSIDSVNRNALASRSSRPDGERSRRSRANVGSSGRRTVICTAEGNIAEAIRVDRVAVRVSKLHSEVFDTLGIIVGGRGGIAIGASSVRSRGVGCRRPDVKVEVEGTRSGTNVQHRAVVEVTSRGIVDVKGNVSSSSRCSRNTSGGVDRQQRVILQSLGAINAGRLIGGQVEGNAFAHVVEREGGQSASLILF